MGQFKALMVKNWILYKRSWVGSIFEIIVPIICVAFIAMIRKIAKITDNEQTQYLNYGSPFTVSFPSNNSLIAGYLKSCTNNKVSGQLSRNGIVALSPGTDPIITQLGTKLTSLGFTTQYFLNDDDIDALVRNPKYGTNSSFPGICFGVSMTKNINHEYTYNLRYNISNSNSQGPDTKGIPTTISKFNIRTITNPVTSGMLAINNVMLNYIMRTQLNDNDYSSEVTISPMTQQAYVTDNIYTYVGNSVDFMVLLPLLIVYLRQTSAMLQQKQKKIRETMKIMGMTNTSYYLSWFLRYFFVYAVVHAICTIILHFSLGYINPGVIFITFILFDILLIVQSFFIQVFFTKAKLGMVIALIFFIIQYVLNFIVRTSGDPSINNNAPASISAHSAYVLVLQQFLYCVSNQYRLGFNDLGTNINEYAVFISWISFALNIVFWLLLTLYLDQVFPNEWGAKKSPLFCFQCPKKSKSRQQELESSSKSFLVQQNVEQVQERFKQKEYNGNAIIIKGLVKEFDNGRKAVNNLNLKIYSDQIFVLLGHNGAGKTTTISMLAGMLEPTSGTISELGFDSKTEMDDIRSQMGLCPQHDTLYQDLTVSEHLYLFGTFKGYDSDLLDQQVEKLIKSVNLEQKVDYISKDLSGGQKRRLSVAMAFVGGSKLIFLDQPTSGMDTTARRFVWQMMKNYKNDRIIILTTHFMDQADFLGDRIGIMSDGKLVCAGSTIFLKNKYGVGYNLTFSKLNTNISSTPIINLITKHISNANITTDVSTQISFQLPMEQVPKFAKMFQQLDAGKDKLGYQSYGVSITTLQEVFLKVAEIRHDNEQQQKQIELPDQKLINQTIQNDYHDIRPEEGIRFWRHMKALWIKRFWMTVKDYKTLAYEFLYPIVVILAAMFLMRINWIADKPAQTMNWGLFNGQAKSRIPVSGNDTIFNTTLLNQLNNDFGSYAQFTQHSSSSVLDFDSNVVFPMKNRFLKGGIYINTQVSSKSYKYYTLINTQSPITPFLLPTTVTQSIINLNKPSTNPPTKINVVNSPLPVTHFQFSLNNTISGFLASFIFSLALSFKFSAIAAFIVKQKQDRSKYQQIVSGMNIYSYWVGNFIFDYALYAIVAAFAAIMCSAFAVTSLIGNGAIGATWALLLLFGLANFPFTYMACFLFKDYSNAQAAVYFFNFVSGGIISTLSLVLRMIGDTGGMVIRGLNWVLRLVPAFAFGQGLINQGSITLLTFSQNNGVQYKVFDWLITLAPIIYLALEAVVYFLLLFLIQYLSNSEAWMRFFSKQSSIQFIQQKDQDNDVAFEQVKAIQSNPSDFAIVTKGLRKVFILPGGDKHKVAVQNLSFTIQKGQVFGLLGVNGAGKTTTFRMLAGEVNSTSGDSYLNGMKISNNLNLVRKNLGYCPQFDALCESLTVTQQLSLYYDLKMLPADIKQKVIQSKIHQLNLQKYKHTQSGTLSGGNKRKLSVACALIGNPPLLFLDEPSTGMDPQARRFMWRVISQIATQKKQCTVILTTHSMQQAQALSTRLGIMVKGGFKCIGTIQHLKSKFGEGYQLEVKLTIPTNQQIVQKLASIKISQNQNITSLNKQQIISRFNVTDSLKNQISQKGQGKFLLNQIKQSGSIKPSTLASFFIIEQRGQYLQSFIQQKFQKPQIIEHFQGFYRFRLKSKTPIGKIFKEFQNNKDKLFIQQYSIKQATVEQIFNKFASQYEYNEED